MVDSQNYPQLKWYRSEVNDDTHRYDKTSIQFTSEDPLALQGGSPKTGSNIVPWKTARCSRRLHGLISFFLHILSFRKKCTWAEFSRSGKWEEQVLK